MSYYTGIAFAPFTEETVMPLKDGSARTVTGIPEGYWVGGWVGGRALPCIACRNSLRRLQFEGGLQQQLRAPHHGQPPCTASCILTPCCSLPQINYVTWSPDSTTIAFTLRSAGGDADPPRQPLELWVADMASGQARRLMDHRLNSIFEE